MQEFLLDQFGLAEHDMYLVDGPVNLNRLGKVCEMGDNPDLFYPAFTQGLPEVASPRG